jgi:nitroreductase
MDEGLKRLSRDLPDFYMKHTPETKFSEAKRDRFRERPLHCSVIIFVCMECDPKGVIPEIEEVEAVACAVQNMHLTCTAYGIGGFWTTPAFIYTDDMRKYLGLAEGGKCLGIFYMGYPAGEWPQSHRKPLEYVTEWIISDVESY